ncbi:MarR family winged helix-turn-helix transcriptional regulator [Hyphomonas sp.]|uniref:MarR family winged helix-turn-helix transcriptional regulator n=1 Tax=Hyphomonas sp. TaxID=87 RepID=UPI001BCFE3E0|nr:MarR family winged helix-turn-helix transcriptional regulator [Hyphomonas sp.]
MSDMPPLRLSTFLPFRLSVLSNAISQRIAALYDREFGLSIWQWRVMAVTADTPGISATEIGQRTQMDKVAVSRAVAGLIEVGYLERRPSEDDARRANLYLTPAGADVYKLIVPLAKAEEAQLVSALSETEQAELTRLMIKLARAACPDRDLW